jgi:hypothetical protein
MPPDDVALAAHYRQQAARLRKMSLFLGGAELKTDLRAASRMYDGLADEVEKSGLRVAGARR